MSADSHLRDGQYTFFVLPLLRGLNHIAGPGRDPVLPVHEDLHSLEQKVVNRRNSVVKQNLSKTEYN